MARRPTRTRKMRKKAKEKLHDQTLEKIDRNPEIIIETVSSLNSAVLLAKEKGPELGMPGRETIDNLLLFETERTYEIVAIEIKAGYYQAGKGLYQLKFAKRFFKRSQYWSEWLRQRIIVKSKEVWLTLLLLQAEPLIEIKEMVFYRSREKLGEIR